MSEAQNALLVENQKPCDGFASGALRVALDALPHPYYVIDAEDYSVRFVNAHRGAHSSRR